MTRVAYGKCSCQDMVSPFSQPEVQGVVHLGVLWVYCVCGLVHHHVERVMSGFSCRVSGMSTTSEGWSFKLTGFQHCGRAVYCIRVHAVKHVHIIRLGILWKFSIPLFTYCAFSPSSCRKILSQHWNKTWMDVFIPHQDSPSCLGRFITQHLVISSDRKKMFY